MKRDIATETTPDIWNLADTAPVLETYADQNFDVSTGERVLAGDVATGTLCRRDVCSVVDGQLIVPIIVGIDTTEDSPDNQKATYSTYLRAANQKPIEWLLNYRIPVGASPTDWTTLGIHKGGIVQRSPLDTYNKQEILALIQQQIDIAVGTLNHMSSTVEGRGYSDVNPILPTHPTLVGLNSRRTLAMYNVKATAVGAVGDGVTDDRTALHTLVNTTMQVTGAGGDVYFPPGDYSIQSGITFPANVRLVFDPQARLKPANGVTLTDLTDHSSWDNSQKFTNALAGQGTVTFAAAPVVFSNTLWWATNTTPGATSMSAALQACLTATGGRGTAYIPGSTYLLDGNTLTIPDIGGGGFAPMVIRGDGPFLSNLVNKMSAGKPTILLNRAAVIFDGIGFWGSDNTHPNDGISVNNVGGDTNRSYIHNCSFFVYGDGIAIKNAHSIFIQHNYGAMSGGAITFPPGVSGLWNYTTEAFVSARLAAAGFANQIVVQNNISEGYAHPVYADASLTFAFSWVITGNQFEGSTNGITLNKLQVFEVSGNYIGEGGTGYTMDLDGCRYGRVGPNYIHLDTTESKSSTVRVNDAIGIGFVGGYFPRLYFTGTSSGVTVEGSQIDRFQDETSDHLVSLINCTISAISVPLGSLNSLNGRASWRSADTNFIAYPTVRLGDQVSKVTPTAGASPGWIATTASSMGALVQTTGSGPDPVVLDDYANPDAYDFRITCILGGVTGVATYKVEWKTQGGGVYADLTNTTTTTELAYLVPRDVGAGPITSFAIRWPTGVTYVAGDIWTLTAVIAPVWKAIAALAA